MYGQNPKSSICIVFLEKKNWVASYFSKKTLQKTDFLILAFLLLPNIDADELNYVDIMKIKEFRYACQFKFTI